MPIRDQLNGTTPQDLSLSGQPGPTFEIEGQRSTSDIQAFVEAGALTNSQDLLTGRTISRRGLPGGSIFAPPSDPPVSAPNNLAGKPYYPALGGPYKNFGPREGRY